MRLLHECLNRRATRIGFLVFMDVAIVFLSYFAALWLRVDLLEGRADTIFNNAYFFATLPWLLAIRIFSNFLFKLYHWSFSHAGLTEGARLTTSLLAGTLAFIVIGHILQILSYPPPRSVYVLEASMSFFGMFALRFLPGYLLLVSAQRVQMHALNNNEALRTIIYGDSDSAAMLAKELLQTHGHGCAVVGFIDDNPAHLNSSIHGIRIFGGLRDLTSILVQNRIEQLLLIGSDLSGRKMRELVDICGPRRVRIRSVPPYRSLSALSGIARSIKDVDPETLLDRQPVDFSSVDMKGFLGGKTVMVTGAGGTIGSELCRQVAGYGARRLLLFDIDENALFFLEMELREKFSGCDIVLLLGSVRDRARLDGVMREYAPDILFHAAAHKHVPIMEGAPGEAIKNNVLGTFETADCARQYKVKRFVLISTDKAVTTTNILGASKRLAELIVRQLNGEAATKFHVVRFGNVLDSSGSLVDVVKKQIALGGAVTVTHPKMERYFMTISEAVGLVLVATVLGEGEINVLDMGEPVKIDSLVRQIVYLAGLVPDQDITIRYTKPRPGERMYEMLYGEDDNPQPSSFSRINIIDDKMALDVEQMIIDARQVSDADNVAAAEAFFDRWVRGFRYSGKSQRDL